MKRPFVLITAALFALSACTVPQAPVADEAILAEPAPVAGVPFDTADPKRTPDECAAVGTLTGDGIGGTGCPAVE